MSRSNKYHCVYEYLMMNMMYLLLQYAVVCTTPYYWNQSLSHPASVWVQLLCPSDNMAGEPKPFQFIPNAPGMDSFCTLIVEGCSLFQRYADTWAKVCRCSAMHRHLFRRPMVFVLKHSWKSTFTLAQCSPTFLTPLATKELILGAKGCTNKLKSSDHNSRKIFKCVNI